MIVGSEKLFQQLGTICIHVDFSETSVHSNSNAQSSMMFTISPRQLPFLGGFSPAFQEKVEKAKAAPAPAVPKESKPEKAAQSHWA